RRCWRRASSALRSHPASTRSSSITSRSGTTGRCSCSERSRSPPSRSCRATAGGGYPCCSGIAPRKLPLNESPEADLDEGSEESTVVARSTRSGFVERLRKRRGALAVGSLLAILSLPLGRTTPGALLDRSFPLGISLAHVNGLRFGKDIVFTYGPLGFLASPQSVFRTGEVLGV